MIGERRVPADFHDAFSARGTLFLHLETVFNAPLAEGVQARNRLVGVYEQLQAYRALKILACLLLSGRSFAPRRR